MSSTGGASVVIGRALAVNRSGLQPVAAIRAALGVTIPFAIGIAVKQPVYGSIAAAGALPAGVAGMVGGGRRRTGLILATTVGMALSTFIGGLVAGHLPLTLAVLAAWGFGAGLAVALGQEASIVGTQALIGLAVFGRFPSSIEASAAHAGFVLAGGALQAVLAELIRSPHRFSAERRALAEAFEELAADRGGPRPAGHRGRHRDSERRRPGRPPSVERRDGPASRPDRRGDPDSARAALARRPPEPAGCRGSAAGGPRLAARGGPLARRARASATGGSRPVPSRRDAARGPQPGAWRAGGHRDPLHGGPRRRASRTAAGRRPHARGAGGGPPVPAAARCHADLCPGAAATRAHHRAGARDCCDDTLVTCVSPRGAARGDAPGRRRGQPSAPRPARLLGDPDRRRRPEAGLRRHRRAWPRPGDRHRAGCRSRRASDRRCPSARRRRDSVLVALLAWASYLVFSASYALYSFAITSLVVMLLSPTGPTSLATVADRGLDTLAGGVIAMIGYVMWPTWEGEGARRGGLAAVLRARGLLRRCSVGVRRPGAHRPRGDRSGCGGGAPRPGSTPTRPTTGRSPSPTAPGRIPSGRPDCSPRPVGS